MYGSSTARTNAAVEINARTPQPKARCTYHECNAVICISNERAFVIKTVRSRSFSQKRSEGEGKKREMKGWGLTLATIQVLNQLESRDSAITIGSAIYTGHTAPLNIFTLKSGRRSISANDACVRVILGRSYSWEWALVQFCR